MQKATLATIEKVPSNFSMLEFWATPESFETYTHILNCLVAIGSLAHISRTYNMPKK